MSKLDRVLKLGSMQEFLEMSEEDLKKAKTSGPLMAGMINKLWRAVCQLADQRNLEAAEVDGLKDALRSLTAAVDDAMESPSEAASWAKTGDMQGYIDKARRSLTEGQAS